MIAGKAALWRGRYERTRYPIRGDEDRLDENAAIRSNCLEEARMRIVSAENAVFFPYFRTTAVLFRE